MKSPIYQQTNKANNYIRLHLITFDCTDVVKSVAYLLFLQKKYQ